ncbi:hypothetical protein C9F11_16570 [Streptomyces sp. YIM 121038]|nr:hypothetical protein C9F11_16570 [Streptomyces sp. YIM 121038]
MDQVGGRAVLDGSVLRQHVRDQVRRVRIAGLGQMDLETVPLDIPLHTRASVGVIGADQAKSTRRALFWVPPSHLALRIEHVLLNPGPAQDLDGGQLAQPHGRPGGVHVGQQAHAVPAGLLGQLGPLGLAGGQPVVLRPGGIPVEPGRISVGGQPVGGRSGECVERSAQGLDDELQPVQRPDRGQYVGGVGAGPAWRLQHSRLPGGLQDVVEDLLPRFRLDQPGAELAEYGVVEARVGKLQAQGVFPVDPGPHRQGRLPIGQPLGELEYRHQREPARGPGRLAPGREQIRELLVPEQHPQLIPQPDRQTALRERRLGHPHRLRGDLPISDRTHRHRHPPHTTTSAFKTTTRS